MQQRTAIFLAFFLLFGCDRAPDTIGTSKAKQAAAATPTPAAASLCVDGTLSVFLRASTCYTTSVSFCGTEAENTAFTAAYKAAEAKLQSYGFAPLAESQVVRRCSNCQSASECPSYFNEAKYRQGQRG